MAAQCVELSRSLPYLTRPSRAPFYFRLIRGDWARKWDKRGDRERVCGSLASVVVVVVVVPIHVPE